MSIQATRRVLVAGAAGFIGRVICREFKARGFDITTLGRSPANHVICDLAESVPDVRPPVDWVIHCAGRAHGVPRSEQDREAIFAANVVGTQNLLKGLDAGAVDPSAVVFISTVAVYGLTRGMNVDEEHPLNASDAYGRSKIEAERVVTKWCGDRGVVLLILRLPLVVGMNAPGNLGVMIRAIRGRYYLGIGKRDARRSMVMAEDVAAGIPQLIGHPGIYHLTDGYHPSVGELERMISAQVGRRSPLAIPLWMGRILARVGDVVDRVLPGRCPVTSAGVEKVSSALTFDDRKARTVCHSQPQRVLDVFRIS